VPGIGDFGVRKNNSFEADYIAGRYGAIPILGDFTKLFSDPTDQTSADSTEEAGQFQGDAALSTYQYGNHAARIDCRRCGVPGFRPAIRRSSTST
jgi:hypothetical protein